jgi:hypothetical protein
LTVTSEPAGSSETSLPVSLSPDGDMPSLGEKNSPAVPAHPGITKPPPSATNKQAGEAAGPFFASAPREETSPKNELDAKDRSEIRATSSAEALDLQIQFERHRDWLEWQRTKRHLVFIAGLMTLSAAFACGLKYAGIPPIDVAKITAIGFISSLGGYGLHAVTAKVWSAISSRDSSSQRQSMR